MCLMVNWSRPKQSTISMNYRWMYSTCFHLNDTHGSRSIHQTQFNVCMWFSCIAYEQLAYASVCELFKKLCTVQYKRNGTIQINAHTKWRWGKQQEEKEDEEERNFFWNQSDGGSDLKMLPPWSIQMNLKPIQPLQLRETYIPPLPFKFIEWQRVEGLVMVEVLLT